MQDDMTLASQVQKQYKDGINYKNRMGYLSKWAEYERMKAGDQWPAATAKTKNLPRPVFNIIELIEAHKVSSVMNENVKMVFSADEGKFHRDSLGRMDCERLSNSLGTQVQIEMIRDEAGKLTGIYRSAFNRFLQSGLEWPIE